jgi:hypothetical protein
LKEKNKFIDTKGTKEELFLFLDLNLTNFYDLKNIEVILEKKLKENYFEVFSFFDFLGNFLDLINRRLNYSKKLEKFFEKFLKDEQKKFKDRHQNLTEKAEKIKERIAKSKKLKKTDLKEFKKILNYLINTYKKILEKLIFILKSSSQIQIKNLILSKNVVEKFKKTSEEEIEEIIFLIKDLIYNQIKDYKVINDFFIEVRDKNIVLILRKDSLYLKDFLIIEDFLNLQKLKDYEKYNNYWKNKIVPLESQNKELEEFFLENKEFQNYYILEDSEEFLLKNYF